MKSKQPKCGRQRNRNRGWAVTVVLGVMGLALAFALAPPVEAQQIKLGGYLSTRYLLRSTDGAQDQDLYESMALDVGDPLSDRATVHMFGRFSFDLDGTRDQYGHYVFDSITDTYSTSSTVRLYYAYVDLHRVQGMDTMRFGRQTMYETPVFLYFDGARIETSDQNPAGFKLGLYGGAPVSLFNSNNKNRSLYGAFIQVKPWEGGKVQLHWTHAEDEFLYGRQKNDFYAAGYWQSLGDFLRYNVMYTRIEDQDRDLKASLVFYQPERDFLFQVSYYELLETQKFYTLDFDPLYAPLLVTYPYYQVGLLASKGLGDNFGVEAGADLRKMKDANNESRFNHEFVFYHGTVYLQDLPAQGLRVSLTGEVWDSYTNQDYIQTYGADVTYKSGQKLRLSVGTDYALYKYDYYLNTELEQVRTYYTRVQYGMGEHLQTDLQYRYEDGELQDFNWLQYSVTYLFGN